MRANSHLDVALGNKSPPRALGCSCHPLGKSGGEKLANSAVDDWDMANLKVIYPGPADHEILIHGTFVISLWPIMSSPLLLQVDAEPPVEAQKIWYLRPGRSLLPTAVLLADQKHACILPEGCNWPFLVPITALSFCP